MSKVVWIAPAACLAFFALCLAGCGGEEELAIEERTPTPAAPAQAEGGLESGMSAAERFGVDAMGQPNMNIPAGAGFDWENPEGWEEAPANSLRLANFIAGPDGQVEAYLSQLPGAAGGLEANINRWRGQMGLEPISEEEIAELPTAEMLGEQAVLVDITGAFTGMGQEVQIEDARMLGAIVEKENQMVFAKLVGPAEAVEAERQAFLEFITSVEQAAPGGAMQGELPEGHPPITPQQQTEGLPEGHPPIEAAGGMVAPDREAVQNLTWEAPPEWKQQEGDPVRFVSYSIADVEDAEAYATVLPGAAGGVDTNINMWRMSMGQSELSPAEIDALETVTVLGKEAPLLEVDGTYTSMGSDANEGWKMLGIIVPADQQTMFIKMVGPADEVTAERDNFISFARSFARTGGEAAAEEAPAESDAEPQAEAEAELPMPEVDEEAPEAPAPAAEAAAE